MAIETLGGDYVLKWDDDTQISVNAHAALLSQFAEAGGFFDRLVETCPMRLTSNNAPEVRDLIAANLWNVFTRLGADGMHYEAATTRPQRIMAHAFREYGTIRRLFPPDIGGQMTMPLA